MTYWEFGEQGRKLVNLLMISRREKKPYQ
jgi:hypothetical protein